MAINKKSRMLILISVLVIVIFATTKSGEQRTMEITDWQGQYIESARSGLSGYDSFIANTEYYGYDDPIISDVSVKISRESSSANEAIKKTAKYVYDNVDYVSNEPDSNCLIGTAPEVLKSGKGQCDTQSMVVISILRKIGVASRPVGGCLVRKNTCVLQSVFPFFAVKSFDLKDVELDPSAESFSRAGGLHAWVQAWDGEKWVDVESTRGVIADGSCYNYHVELFPNDNQKDLFCTSKSYQYSSACKNNDLVELNKYGLGLAAEVSS